MVASTNFHVKIYNAGDSGDRDDQDFFNDDPFNGNEVQGYFLHRGYQGDRDKQEGSASLKTSEQKKNHATCKMCPSARAPSFMLAGHARFCICLCVYACMFVSFFLSLIIAAPLSHF